ncbi:hypothetical protein [Simkania sp.]|uniref:hypothetical protein n=1 Tax=Simkania sp. TaxID=34094 RepID=UPI003B51B623
MILGWPKFRQAIELHPTEKPTDDDKEQLISYLFGHRSKEGWRKIKKTEWLSSVILALQKEGEKEEVQIEDRNINLESLTTPFHLFQFS